MGRRAFRETAKNDPLHAGFRETRDGGNRDLCRALGMKAVSAGGDRGKSNGEQAILFCNRERAAVAGGQKIILAALPSPPDGTNRMNDKTRGQIVSGCDFGVARGTAAEF